MFVEQANNVKEFVTQAIQKAAQSTGVDFSYLMKTAQRESGANLNPNAKAGSSSATGTFQFVESTWLQMVKEHGKDAGIGQYADAISQNSAGQFIVKNPQLREEILSLRSDPETSSFLAARLTQSNAQSLTDSIGRAPTGGELYMAHFMGAGGASKLINAMQANPNANAADLFPKEAAANPGIFKTGGKSRTVGEVYAELNKSHGDVNVENILTASLEQKNLSTMPETAYAGLKKSNAPLFHTMTVAGKPSVKMVTAYLPKLEAQTHNEGVGAASGAQLRHQAYGYQRNMASASNKGFFSTLTQPVMPLDVSSISPTTNRIA